MCNGNSRVFQLGVIEWQLKERVGLRLKIHMGLGNKEKYDDWTLIY